MSNTRKFRRRIKYPNIEYLDLDKRVQACGVFKDILLKDPNWERPGSPLNVQKPLKNGGKIPEIPLLSLTTITMFLKKRVNLWN
ncbi:unnamed protein product [marine sediment metagenome]|uniref:Uncharacterized protein n=1 Tax=marine sediment metagenome TaxID=412755 RepID=X1MD51_9ZZZZ